MLWADVLAAGGPRTATAPGESTTGARMTFCTPVGGCAHGGGDGPGRRPATGGRATSRLIGLAQPGLGGDEATHAGRRGQLQRPDGSPAGHAKRSEHDGPPKSRAARRVLWDRVFNTVGGEAARADIPAQHETRGRDRGACDSKRAGTSTAFTGSLLRPGRGVVADGSKS